MLGLPSAWTDYTKVMWGSISLHSVCTLAVAATTRMYVVVTCKTMYRVCGVCRSTTCRAAVHGAACDMPCRHRLTDPLIKCDKLLVHSTVPLHSTRRDIASHSSIGCHNCSVSFCFNFMSLFVTSPVWLFLYTYYQNFVNRCRNYSLIASKDNYFQCRGGGGGGCMRIGPTQV